MFYSLFFLRDLCFTDFLHLRICLNFSIYTYGSIDMAQIIPWCQLHFANIYFTQTKIYKVFMVHLIEYTWFPGGPKLWFSV